jgi:hypothetical protein
MKKCLILNSRQETKDIITQLCLIQHNIAYLDFNNFAQTYSNIFALYNDFYDPIIIHEMFYCKCLIVLEHGYNVAIEVHEDDIQYYYDMLMDHNPIIVLLAESDLIKHEGLLVNIKKYSLIECAQFIHTQIYDRTYH